MCVCVLGRCACVGMGLVGDGVSGKGGTSSRDRQFGSDRGDDDDGCGRDGGDGWVMVVMVVVVMVVMSGGNGWMVVMGDG